jgi:acetyltransferase-like isoleucine patch superfamily enzyme
MSEKEKAEKGLLYNANYDKALIEERSFAKGLCHEYNQLHPKKVEERKTLIKKLLGKTRENFLIEQPFVCDYGYNIEIGENFYINHNSVMLDAAKITFGDNVFIAPNCGFYAAGHPLDAEQRNQGLEYAYPISIGNNVWIGGGVTVLPGVTIGDNTIVGAGSVVTKDIPSGVIAVGNPCRVIREITEADKKKYHRE